jgi:hypothetical protein
MPVRLARIKVGQAWSGEVGRGRSRNGEARQAWMGWAR